MARVLIVDDDQMMTECFGYMLPEHQVETCTNAITALDLINAKLPDVILLDIFLDGPDGFSLLNELISYNDTMTIPVIVVSSLDLSQQDLSHYGVVKVLQKETMTPELLNLAVQEALAHV